VLDWVCEFIVLFFAFRFFFFFFLDIDSIPLFNG